MWRSLDSYNWSRAMKTAWDSMNWKVSAVRIRKCNWAYSHFLSHRHGKGLLQKGVLIHFHGLCTVWLCCRTSDGIDRSHWILIHDCITWHTEALSPCALIWIALKFSPSDDLRSRLPDCNPRHYFDGDTHHDSPALLEIWHEQKLSRQTQSQIPTVSW